MLTNVEVTQYLLGRCIGRLEFFSLLRRFIKSIFRGILGAGVNWSGCTANAHVCINKMYGCAYTISAHIYDAQVDEIIHTAFLWRVSQHR